jgi:iron(III) transport system permease protein
MTALARSLIKPRVTQVATRDEWLMWGLIALSALWLMIGVVLPLGEIAWRSVSDESGHWVGWANYAKYFGTPALANSFSNSLFVSLVSTLIAVTLAFVYAYALTRTAMHGKSFFRIVAMLPIYAPSVAHAIALVYLFGKKGLVTTGVFGLVPGWDIGLYGATGIILGQVVYCFPQALLILLVGLSLSDARLYEASIALRASSWRTFITVTLPSIKYSLVSAVFVCFTLVFTDFGVAKVVGGNYNVLATDIYKQVIGQQNFMMGATISILLLAPTALAFVVDRLVQRRQMALVTSRAVPLQPKPKRWVDRAAFGFCALIAATFIGLMGVVLYASLVQVWPYQLNLGLRHYNFDLVGGGGLSAYFNSVQIALYTALFGTCAVFGSAYLIEKGRGVRWLRTATYLISMLPMALPGLVIGLAYIFFFNQPTWNILGVVLPNPLNPLYNTMAILVISNIVHFYTVAFLAAMTALKQMDPEFESVAASLHVPFYRTLWLITVPVSLPAILEIAMYFFVNAMVTVSAVIFLYSPEIKLAAVAIVNMEDAGDVASAAAMSALVIVTSIGVRVLYEFVSRGILRRAQAWRSG